VEIGFKNKQFLPEPEPAATALMPQASVCLVAHHSIGPLRRRWHPRHWAHWDSAQPSLSSLLLKKRETF